MKAKGRDIKNSDDIRAILKGWIDHVCAGGMLTLCLCMQAYACTQAYMYVCTCECMWTTQNYLLMIFERPTKRRLATVTAKRVGPTALVPSLRNCITQWGWGQIYACVRSAWETPLWDEVLLFTYFFVIPAPGCVHTLCTPFLMMDRLSRS